MVQDMYKNFPVDDLIQAMIPWYIKGISTKGDIDAVIAFYLVPRGARNFCRKCRRLRRRAWKLSMGIAQKMVAKMQQQIQDQINQMQQEKKQAAETPPYRIFKQWFCSTANIAAAHDTMLRCKQYPDCRCRAALLRLLPKISRALRRKSAKPRNAARKSSVRMSFSSANISCQAPRTLSLDLAEAVPGPSTEALAKVARENKVVLVASFSNAAPRALSQHLRGD